MTPKAKQILEILHQERPDILFEWLPVGQYVDETSLHVIKGSLKSDLSKTNKITFQSGIAAHTAKELASDIITHIAQSLDEHNG